MEDSVPGAESLLHPENPSSIIAEIEEAEEVDNSNNEAKGGEEKPGGFINSLISNLVTADKHDEERGQKEDDDEHKETVAEGKGEEKVGGLLDHLLSNLVSPLSPKAGDISQGKCTQPFKINGNEGSGSEEHVASSPSSGGLIKNVISNFFHHPSEADEAKDQHEKHNEEEIVKIAEENHNKKRKTEEGGGVSIIDNIVSHLPTSIREDVAPTTDEASILIHSIIHD